VRDRAKEDLDQGLFHLQRSNYPRETLEEIKIITRLKIRLEISFISVQENTGVG